MPFVIYTPVECDMPVDSGDLRTARRRRHRGAHAGGDRRRVVDGRRRLPGRTTRRRRRCATSAVDVSQADPLDLDDGCRLAAHALSGVHRRQRWRDRAHAGHAAHAALGGGAGGARAVLARGDHVPRSARIARSSPAPATPKASAPTGRTATDRAPRRRPTGATSPAPRGSTSPVRSSTPRCLRCGRTRDGERTVRRVAHEQLRSVGRARRDRALRSVLRVRHRSVEPVADAGGVVMPCGCAAEDEAHSPLRAPSRSRSRRPRSRRACRVRPAVVRVNPTTTPRRAR